MRPTRSRPRTDGRPGVEQHRGGERGRRQLARLGEPLRVRLCFPHATTVFPAVERDAGPSDPVPRRRNLDTREPDLPGRLAHGWRKASRRPSRAQRRRRADRARATSPRGTPPTPRLAHRELKVARQVGRERDRSCLRPAPPAERWAAITASRTDTGSVAIQAAVAFLAASSATLIEPTSRYGPARSDTSTGADHEVDPRLAGHRLRHAPRCHPRRRCHPPRSKPQRHSTDGPPSAGASRYGCIHDPAPKAAPSSIIVRRDQSA